MADHMSQDESAGHSTTGGALQSITEGASIYVVGKVLSNVLGFVFTVVLTRSLGAYIYGIYTYATTIISVVQILSRLGSGESLLKFIPERAGDTAAVNWVTSVAYLTAFLASVTFGSVLFVGAPVISMYYIDDPLMVDVVRIFAIVLPVRSLLQLTSAVFRALERLHYQVLIEDVLEPGTKIVVAGGAILLGHSLVGVVAAIAIGTVFVLAAAFAVLYDRTDVRPFGHRSDGDLRSFFDFSLPLTLRDLGESLYNRFDILMVGFFLTGTVVGIYRVAILLTTILTLPLAGINQLFPPIASKLYAEDRIGDLTSIYKIITRWVFIISLVPAMALIIYGQVVLRVFGEGFTNETGWLILALFTLAQLFNVSIGPTGFLLMMTNNQYYNMANQWVLGLSNIVLNYVLIIEFGAIGAAAATAGTLAFINLLRLFEIWTLEGLHPYSVRYWKPVVAGIGSGAVMTGLHVVLDGYVLVVVGGITGGLVFTSILFLLGIEDEDKRFFREYINWSI